MTTSLRSNLHTLAVNFAATVIGIVRSTPLEDLLSETSERGTGSHRVPAAARASSPRSTATAAMPTPRATAARSRARLKRRSAEDVALVVGKVVALVKRHKAGLRAEQIRGQLNMRPNEMPRVLSEGLARKVIKKKGQKRATTYYVR